MDLQGSARQRRVGLPVSAAEITLGDEIPDIPDISTETELPSMDRTLNRMHDRCDRCNSEAYGRAVMPTGVELLFCGHHLAQHLPALRAQALHVQDERMHINPKPSVAAY